MTADAPVVPGPPVRIRRPRWWPGITILTAGVLAQTTLLIRFADDATFSKMSVLWVWPGTLFALLLWWLLASNLTWRTRLIPLGILSATALVLGLVFRIEGSDGDMVPRLAFRWTPDATAVAREYWQQQPTETQATTPQPAVAETTATPTVEPAPLVAGPDDWPDYRGPQRDGIIRGTGFRTNWDTQPPVELWRHPVGLAWSSFAVLGDYVITMEQRDERESVVCYHLQTGEPIWIQGDVTRFTAVEVNGGDGPHATPVITGEETYTLGATGLLNCWKTRTGERVWTRPILQDAGMESAPAPNLEWGVSSTPLVVGDLVIAIAGGTAGKSVLAYDRMSGDLRWSKGQFPASYSGPRVEDFLGQPQLLVFHGEGIAGANIDDGNILWQFAWKNLPLVNAAQPIKLDDSSLVIGSGYGMGAVRLKLAQEAGAWSVSQEWKTNRFKLKFNDALLIDGYLYGLDDGILTCIDATTGKTRWKGLRAGYGQLLGFEQTLLILTETGDVVLAAASPEKFQELSRIHVLEGTTWNHPVVAHGRLLVRNNHTAACYDVAP